MARRWTPQRFTALRRLRVVICALATFALCATFFLCTTRKAVALSVNGETRHVTTYATTVTGLLREQGVDVKTHDLVQSTSAGVLTNHDVVTVKSAYQTTISIDGQEVPFWTVADSAEQLLSFFEQNEVAASRVRVDIKNVYNQLTGGFVVNADGPVTVVADGKTSVAPNGKLPAASILDSKSIVLGKDDRVSVEKDGGKTILRVERVTYGDETATESIPYVTRLVTDASLAPGETRVEQAGVNGEKRITYRVTYVDGKAQTREQTDETVTKVALDEVIAVGPKAPAKTDDNADTGANAGDDADDGGADDNSGDDGNATDDSTGDPTAGTSSPEPSETQTPEPDPEPSTSEPTQQPTQAPTQTPTQQPKPTQTPTQQPTQKPTPTQQPTQTPTQQPTQQPSNPAAGSRLYRPTAAAAQAYAAGAAAQYGWTGKNWQNLVNLWNRESGWRWNAENPWSGAYGIPQSLPPSKMAAFGANYRDDAAAQIDWGLSYIAGCYGSPNKAWEHSEHYGWY